MHTCSPAGWELTRQPVPGRRREALATATPPVEHSGCQWGSELPGVTRPPETRLQSGWCGGAPGGGEQVPCSHLPKALTPPSPGGRPELSPQAGRDAEAAGGVQRGGAGYSACTPTPAQPQADFPDPLGLLWGLGAHLRSKWCAGATCTARCPPGLRQSFPAGPPGRKQLTHTSASPRLEATRLEPGAYKIKPWSPPRRRPHPCGPDSRLAQEGTLAPQHGSLGTVWSCTWQADFPHTPASGPV